MAVLKSLLSVLCLLGGAWGVFALVYQGPQSTTLRVLCVGAWVLLSAATMAALWKWPLPAGAFYAMVFVLLLAWWLRIEPSNDRDWAPEVAQQATGQIDGRWVTLDSVRNFDWHTKTDYDVRWEQRRYDLDRLSSVDMILSYWGRPGIAHTLVSFGFDDGEYVTFSVEVRKERSEAFSEIGGFFRQFEASVIAADERDIVRLRTNVRGEDVYLYRVQLSPEAQRALFIAYVEEANAWALQPRFYNTLTVNCTTVIYSMLAKIVDGVPLDYRLLLSGLLPEYLHGLDGLAPGHSIAELRERGRITQRALDADRDPDFSRLIRRGIPGIHVRE